MLLRRLLLVLFCAVIFASCGREIYTYPTAHGVGFTSNKRSRDGVAKIIKILVTHPDGRGFTLAQKSLKRVLAKSRFDVLYGQTVYPGDTVDVTWQWDSTYCSVAAWSAYDTSESSSFDPASIDDTNFNDYSISVQKVNVPANFPAPGAVNIGVRTVWSGSSNVPQGQGSSPAPCSEQNTDSSGDMIYVSATSTPSATASSVPTSSPTASPKPTLTPKPTPSPTATLPPCEKPYGGAIAIDQHGNAANALIQTNAPLRSLMAALSNNGVAVTIHTGNLPPLEAASTILNSPTTGTITFSPANMQSAESVGQVAQQILFHELDHLYYQSLTGYLANTPSTTTFTLNKVQYSYNTANIATANGFTNSEGQKAWEHMLIHDDLVNNFGADDTGALSSGLAGAINPPSNVGGTVATDQSRLGTSSRFVAAAAMGTVCKNPNQAQTRKAVAEVSYIDSGSYDLVATP